MKESQQDYIVTDYKAEKEVKFKWKMPGDFSKKEGGVKVPAKSGRILTSGGPDSAQAEVEALFKDLVPAGTSISASWQGTPWLWYGQRVHVIHFTVAAH